jgi:curved DNA-binding protein CbpA
VSTNKDLYAVLGVLPDAEQEVIRAVYLALAKKYHPDSSGNADGAEKLKEINAAYEVLSDPAKRKAYDATRPEGKDAMGDYEPDVDDEDLSVDDFKDDWNFAVEYHPELVVLLKEVAAISPTLSIVFQTTILSNKAFNEARKIKEKLILSFLRRYFGSSETIQSFARNLLIEKRMEAVNELNKAIRILGDSINAVQLIQKIERKYGIPSSSRTNPEFESSISGVISQLRKLGYEISGGSNGPFSVTNLQGRRSPFKSTSEELRALLKSSRTN